MLSKFSKDRVVGTPSKWPNEMVFFKWGDPNYVSLRPGIHPPYVGLFWWVKTPHGLNLRSRCWSRSQRCHNMSRPFRNGNHARRHPPTSKTCSEFRKKFVPHLFFKATSCGQAGLFLRVERLICQMNGCNSAGFPGSSLG